MVEKAAPQDTKKSTPITFHTTILQNDKNAAGIEIPAAVLAELGGGKRPLVRVTIKEYTYRSAVATVDGKFMVGVSAENRQAAGVRGGDQVDVTLALDLQPRTVEIPQDLKSALVAAGALEAFEKSAPSMRKEYAPQVEEAKAQETRQRRIAKIVEKLKSD